jgi:hypothetical protein
MALFVGCTDTKIVPASEIVNGKVTYLGKKYHILNASN